MFPTVESSQLYTTFPTGYDVGNLYDTHSAICIVLFPIRATSSCLPSSIRPVDVLHFEDVPKAIANYHVCIVKSMRVDSDIISRAIQMQLIMQYGVGMEGKSTDNNYTINFVFYFIFLSSC